MQAYLRRSLESKGWKTIAFKVTLSVTVLLSSEQSITAFKTSA